MKVADLFASAAALLGGKEPTSRAAVEVALRDREAREKAAAANLERLAPRRAELLLSGSDAEVETHDATASRTALERDRAVAIAAKLRERLAAIVAAEAAAERDRRRDEVGLQCELAVEALRTRYPKAVAEVLAVLRTVATAGATIAAFAREYPSEPPIADPEDVVRRPTPIAWSTAGSSRTAARSASTSIWRSSVAAPGEMRTASCPASPSPSRSACTVTSRADHSNAAASRYI